VDNAHLKIDGLNEQSVQERHLVSTTLLEVLQVAHIQIVMAIYFVKSFLVKLIWFNIWTTKWKSFE